VLPSPDSDSCAAEDPEAALREMRAEFIRGFPEEVTSAAALAAAAADPRQSKPLLHVIHQMADLAGIVGFPALGRRANELEQWLSARSDSHLEPGWIQTVLDTLIRAFDDDQLNPPAWVNAPAASPAGTVLIAADDPVPHRAVFRVPRSAVLPYDAFQTAAGQLLQTGETVIALVRLPSHRQADVLASFVGEFRKSDLVGRYDPDHLVLAMPDLESAVACARLRDAIARLRAWAPAGLAAGVAAASPSGEHRLAALIADAQAALAEARQDNETAAVKSARPGASRAATLVNRQIW
jgi:hypothetical protein